MTWREEVIGDCRLILGDCRDVLPALGDIDAVIADPPYVIPHAFGIHRSPHGTRTLEFSWDGIGKRDMVIDAARICVGMGRAHFWWCGISCASQIQDLFLSVGMVPKMAAWVKTCPPPASPGNWWPSGFELGIYAYHHGAWFGDKNPRRSNVFISDSYRFGQPGKVDHPTQKPLGVMRRIVSAIAPPGGRALDPFMGSGTTGVACVESGRAFTGIEIDSGYFDLACRRIENAHRQGRLDLRGVA